IWRARNNLHGKKNTGFDETPYRVVCNAYRRRCFGHGKPLAIFFCRFVGVDSANTSNRRDAVSSPSFALASWKAHSIERRGVVLVAGRRCPIVGLISMDLMAVDVTDLPGSAVRRGDYVTLIGEGFDVDALAEQFNTNGYEVLTSLGRRYARIYKGTGG
ncbi:hypothetical protein B4Q13_22810, partial [Lacticaseibacillus rhamnosus]